MLVALRRGSTGSRRVLSPPARNGGIAAAWPKRTVWNCMNMASGSRVVVLLNMPTSTVMAAPAMSTAVHAAAAAPYCTQASGSNAVCTRHEHVPAAVVLTYSAAMAVGHNWPFTEAGSPGLP